MAIDKRKVESGLRAKGFRNSDKDHRYFTYWSLDGKKTQNKTKTSHSPKEKSLDRARIGQMAKQCGLTTEDFIKLIECPMNQSTYEHLLRGEGLV